MSQEAGFCLLVSCLCWATTLQIGSYSLYLVFISFATSHPYLLYYLLGGDLINFYWSIQLIYSVVVVSAVEQISYIYTYLSTSVTYTRICSFLGSFPILVISECWVEFPVLHSGFLLFINFILICCWLFTPFIWHFQKDDKVQGILFMDFPCL